MGPYDKRQASVASSITWFHVDHPPGALPGEGQRPEAVGCVAKALQMLQLSDGGGAGTQAEIATMPSSVLQQLAQRYASKPNAGAAIGLPCDTGWCLGCLWAAAPPIGLVVGSFCIHV